MKNIAVFASGNGSNFQVIAEQIRDGGIRGAHLKLLVTNKPDAYVVRRAEAFDTPVLALRPVDYPSKEAFEHVILDRLLHDQIDYVVLAGYMRLIGPTILNEYAGRIINLHPSLLPAFAGKDAVGQAYAYGVKVTGITVHLVDEGLDTGPIIAQKAIEVREGESLERLTDRIHQAEHQLLPQVVQWLVDGRVRVDGRKVEIV